MVACAVLAAGWLGGWLRGTPGRAEKRERKRKIPFPVKLRIGGKRIRFFQKKKFDLTQGGRKTEKAIPPTKWQQRVDFCNYQFVLENGFKIFRPFEACSSGSL